MRSARCTCSESGDVEGEQGRVIPRDPVLLRLPDSWQRPEAPVAPSILVRSLVRATAVAAVEFDWVTETARHVGTVVHRELQRYARESGALPSSEAERDAVQRRYAVELAELAPGPALVVAGDDPARMTVLAQVERRRRAKQPARTEFDHRA